MAINIYNDYIKDFRFILNEVCKKFGSNMSSSSYTHLTLIPHTVSTLASKIIQTHDLGVLPASSTHVEWTDSCIALHHNCFLTFPLKLIAKLVRNCILIDHLSKCFCQLENISLSPYEFLANAQLAVITLYLKTKPWANIVTIIKLPTVPIIWCHIYLIVIWQ